MPTKEEFVLGIVLQFINPTSSIAPLKLAKVSKYLYELGVTTGRTKNLGLYLTPCVNTSFEAELGRSFASSILFPDAMFSSCVYKLPGGDTHGFSFSVTVPVSLQLSEGTHEMLCLLDTCREYHRREWTGGKLSGRTVAVHTCDDNGVVRSAKSYMYRNGNLHGNSYYMYKTLGQSEIGIVVRKYINNVNVESRTDILPPQFTRKWRTVCGDDDVLYVRHLYNTYFAAPVNCCVQNVLHTDECRILLAPILNFTGDEFSRVNV